jgi:hypothetical protein
MRVNPNATAAADARIDRSVLSKFTDVSNLAILPNALGRFTLERDGFFVATGRTPIRRITRCPRDGEVTHQPAGFLVP